MLQTSSYTISRYWRLAYVGLAVVLAGLFEVFVWGRKPGLGFLFFVILGLIGFISLAIATKRFRQPWALLLLIPIIVLSVDIFLYNNFVIRLWSRILVLGLMILFAVLSTYDNSQKYKFSFLGIPFFRSGFLMLSKIGHAFRDLFIWKESRRQVYGKIALGVLIAAPLLFIFTKLFFSADVVFAESIKNFFSLSFNEEIIGRILRITLLSMFLAGLFYVTCGQEHALGKREASIKKLDPVIVGVVLFLINALFALFVFFQIKYLFGNAEFVLQSGLTFAEYARNGFFELVWVMIFASLVVLTVYRSLIHHSQHWVIKLLSFALVAQIFIVALSALTRMNLYQSEYGFTVLRLYVEWFIYFAMFLLAVLTVGLIFKLQFRNLFYTFLISGLCAVTVVYTLNVDLIIAKRNTRMALEEGTELDVDYLWRLSVDIVPALSSLPGDYSNRIKVKAGPFDGLAGLVQLEKKDVENIDPFLEFNWGRFQAREILKSL